MPSSAGRRDRSKNLCDCVDVEEEKEKKRQKYVVKHDVYHVYIYSFFLLASVCLLCSTLFPLPWPPLSVCWGVCSFATSTLLLLLLFLFFLVLLPRLLRLLLLFLSPSSRTTHEHVLGQLCRRHDARRHNLWNMYVYG